MADEMRRRRETVARAFTERRAALGLTQEQVAQRADIVVKSVYNFEVQGRWPNARTRARLEQAIEWAPGEIDRLAQPPPPRIDQALINATVGYTADEIEALLKYKRREESEPRRVNGGHDGT